MMSLGMHNMAVPATSKAQSHSDVELHMAEAHAEEGSGYLNALCAACLHSLVDCEGYFPGGAR